jgi:hypothetical protein
MPTRRSPLTRQQLRQIGERSPTRDTRDLLWEIHRLRTIVLQAEQLETRLRDMGVVARLDPTTKMIAEVLADSLCNEPVVLEAAQGRRVPRCAGRTSLRIRCDCLLGPRTSGIQA